MLSCNQPLFLLTTIGDLIPTFVIAEMFIIVAGIVTLFRAAKISEGDAGAEMEPLCVWEYSAAEWQKYAVDYDLAKFPKGASRVQITLLDVWIIDDGMVRRTILDEERKCVTACRFENRILKIRVRSWASQARFGGIVYRVQDVRLPVPFGYEAEVNQVVKLFNENIVRMNKKVSSVMPDTFLNGVVSETDF